ncbi:hypothetical protein RND81_03G175900 [Saponaria officinalis]|uniref:Uncharacterized protein n=1 Tax=Saponaria officinalis TaxID=3572 RepID=A0AAW1M0Z4_SAPOF
MAESGEYINSWTWEQNKAFENGLAIYPENCEQRWQKIASNIPGYKTIEEVKQHYQILLDDIAEIEAGYVTLPNYSDVSTNKVENERDTRWERRRGQAWTEEEHKQFLLGMARYGKGDWKTIAKEFVRTRTSTQVASHAQKHFKRQERKKKKEGKRWSIFDITNPNDRQKDGGEGEERINEIIGSEQVPTTTTTTITTGTTKLDINEATSYDMGNNNFVSRPMSPPWSPPQSWCVDSDDSNGSDLAHPECLSQLAPS